MNPDLTFEERLAQDAADVWRRICNRAATVSTAVFFTPHGLEFCKAGGRDQATYMHNHGDGFLGIYNNRVRIDHFIEDVFAAARERNLL